MLQQYYNWQDVAYIHVHVGLDGGIIMTTCTCTWSLSQTFLDFEGRRRLIATPLE